MDERAARRPTFGEGTGIRLADGQTWTLPGRSPEAEDPEFDGIIRAVFEAEDDAERLRSELALTILLLSRNYDLKPGDYQRLLGYRPNDPALAEMQRAVHDFVMDQARRHHALLRLAPPAADAGSQNWQPNGQERPPLRVRSGWTL
jgi:hypothetical protein